MSNKSGNAKEVYITLKNRFTELYVNMIKLKFSYQKWPKKTIPH